MPSVLKVSQLISLHSWTRTEQIQLAKQSLMYGSLECISWHLQGVPSASEYKQFVEFRNYWRWSFCKISQSKKSHTVNPTTLGNLRVYDFWSGNQQPSLSYHYDWTARKYHSNRRGVFPVDLEMLTKKFAGMAGYNDFKAEAAIVNFYPPGTTLGGHLDDVEENMEQPIISIR